MEPTKTFELICNNKKIHELSYDSKTNVHDVKTVISSLFSLEKENIKLLYDKKKLDNDNAILDSLLLTKVSQIGGEKIHLKIIPQIHIEPILRTFIFEQVENEENRFSLQFEAFIKIEALKEQISSYFNKMFSELNYIIESVNFLNNPGEDKENPDFNANDKKVIEIFKAHETSLYFLVKNSSINIYKSGHVNHNTTQRVEMQPQSHLMNSEGITYLRKNLLNNESFGIIIQTYNGMMKEIIINNQMIVFDLKQLIEKELKIGMEYQELFYLVYRLNRDDIQLIRYNLKPRSTIFLRGFYFPIIFSDFYTKKQNYLKINIATKVEELKNELIYKFKIDCDYIDLVCNGKILDNEKFLIEYCIQKLQNIYIK